MPQKFDCPNCGETLGRIEDGQLTFREVHFLRDDLEDGSIATDELAGNLIRAEPAEGTAEGKVKCPDCHYVFDLILRKTSTGVEVKIAQEGFIEADVTIRQTPTGGFAVSDQYVLSSEEVRHVLNDPTLAGDKAQIEKVIDNREVISFSPREGGELKATFRPKTDDPDEWLFSYGGRDHGTRLKIPRLEEIMVGREPVCTADELLSDQQN